MIKFTFTLILSCIFLLVCAAEILIYEIKIKDHQFTPSIIEVPTDTLIKLKIINLDPTIEEFESFDLKREKIVTSNGGKAIITIGPLKPGEYKFFGEFHPDTAQGKLIVKEKNA